MEHQSQGLEGQVIAPVEPRPPMSVLDWLAGGFVLSTFSPTWYYNATRQPLGWAVGFLTLFAVTLTVLQSLSVWIGMRAITPEIRAGLIENDVPEIVISGGIAEVEGPQPNILFDQDGMVFILDTTGEIETIDPERYDQGMLLTRTEFIQLQETGEIQVIPLAQLQALMGQDPLIFNEDTIPQYWDTLSGWLGAGAFVGLLIWHGFIRLAAILGYGLVIWGITTALRPGTKYPMIFAAGVYSIVPALYLRYLFSLAAVDFVFLTTLLWLPIWALTTAFAVWPRTQNPSPQNASEYFASLRPLRSWRALIAVPLLIDFVVQHFLFPNHHWGITWGLAVVTFAALFVISLLPLFKLSKSAPGEPPAPPTGSLG